MSKPEIKAKSRLETLDHLRGFFIVVIIIDHLSRYPSIFVALSGKALLWVTAAEGFVSISGLLVGYVRGYKNRNESFKAVSIKLLRRALMLYIWSLIGSIVYVAIIWYIPLPGGAPGIPITKGDWPTFLTEIVTMHYTWTWVYFLTLYAIFLAVAPIAVWLLRRNLSWLVALLSSLLLIVGWMTKSEMLQWQFLFFIPSVVGFYLQNILDWWRARKRSTQIAIALTTVSATVITIATSVIFAYYSQSFAQFASYVNGTLFSKDSISLLRAATAFLWFVGYIFIFYTLRGFIKKYFNWLLIPVGTHSLTAYLLHGIALCTISFFTAASDHFWLNTLLGIVAVLITLGLLKIPFVRKIIPS